MFGQSKIRASKQRGSKGGVFRCWQLSQRAQCLGCVNSLAGICIGTIPPFTFWQVLGLETVLLNLRPVCWPGNQYHAIYFVSPLFLFGDNTHFMLCQQKAGRELTLRGVPLLLEAAGTQRCGSCRLCLRLCKELTSSACLWHQETKIFALWSPPTHVL